jgi:hypothetical protein
MLHSIFPLPSQAVDKGRRLPGRCKRVKVDVNAPVPGWIFTGRAVHQVLWLFRLGYHMELWILPTPKIRPAFAL